VNPPWRKFKNIFQVTERLCAQRDVVAGDSDAKRMQDLSAPFIRSMGRVFDFSLGRLRHAGENSGECGESL
jgi:hypothetical protein